MPHGSFLYNTTEQEEAVSDTYWIVEAFNAIVENKDSFKVKWLDGLKSEDATVRYRSKQFLKIIDEAWLINRFDTELFIRMLEKFVVDCEKKIVVDLLDGTEVEVEIK